MNAASTVFRNAHRLVAVLLGLGAAALIGAAPAGASTTASVSMTFNEPKHMDFVSGCSVFLAFQGLCGIGNAVPYGHATETIVFGGACGGGCDLRTVTVADGTIVMHEHLTSNFVCPGAGAPGACEATLADEVVGGTGLFAGATGSLRGTVTGTGPQSQIQLSGTITTV
jgi:hypothetical protein